MRNERIFNIISAVKVDVLFDVKTLVFLSSGH